MGRLAAILGGLWAVLDRLGVVLGGLGAVLGRLGGSWRCLGPSWVHLGAVLGGPGAVLGPSWGRLGGSWGGLGAVLGPSRGRPPPFGSMLGGLSGPNGSNMAPQNGAKKVPKWYRCRKNEIHRIAYRLISLRHGGGEALAPLDPPRQAGSLPLGVSAFFASQSRKGISCKESPSPAEPRLRRHRDRLFSKNLLKNWIKKQTLKNYQKLCQLGS